MSPTTIVAEKLFEVEQHGDTLIVVPTRDLREMESRRIEAEAEAILVLLNSPAIKNVVLDFSQTDYYGSTALGFFVKLWKGVRGRKGRLAFCNVSDHEREILHVTHLDHAWPIYSSRIEALRAVRP